MQAHATMVTCLDALDATSILSAGMDGLLHRWDFRKLGTQVRNTRRQGRGGRSKSYGPVGRFALQCSLKYR